jgi:hypothetical protein
MTPNLGRLAAESTGLRRADGSGPVEPHWLFDNEGTSWLMSANFRAGVVKRPIVLEREQDPQWQLLTSGPMKGPGGLFGEAANVDAAKDGLLRAWQAWLVWAELA